MKKTFLVQFINLYKTSAAMIILLSIPDGMGFSILRRKNDEGRLTKEDVDEKC